MKNALMVMSMLGMLVHGSSSLAGIQLSKYPKVYKGVEGASVLVAPLSPKDKNQALIKVYGVDTTIDGQVFLYDLVYQGRAQAYSLKTFTGQTRIRLRIEKGYWTRWVTLYLPDHRDGIKVWYDDEASKHADRRELLRQYLGQKPVNKQTDKIKSRAEANQHLAKSKAAVEAACGRPIATSVDWASIPAGQLKLLDIGTYCEQPALALINLCQDPDYREAVAKSIRSVRCRFGSSKEVELNKGELEWTTSIGAPSQSIYIQEHLTDSL